MRVFGSVTPYSHQTAISYIAYSTLSSHECAVLDYLHFETHLRIHRSGMAPDYRWCRSAAHPGKCCCAFYVRSVGRKHPRGNRGSCL